MTILAVASLALFASGIGAQSTRPPLDTTALRGDARTVYKLWQTYLASKGGHYATSATIPSPHWNAAEQARWPVYDLAGFYLPDGAVPQIVAVEPTRPDGREYRIITRFYSSAAATRPEWETAPRTVTVYAIREADRWALANALPRNTSAWVRDSLGPITYVFARDYPFNRPRAERAVAFADSVAAAFGVPRLRPITYYLTANVDELYRIMGLESDVSVSGIGGVAQPVNRQLFSGSPIVGEEYRHELAHVVLAPLVSGSTYYIVSEGVPTWLGGTAGKDFPTAVRELAAFLAARPAVTLDSLLSGGYATTQLYPAGGVLAVMAHEHGGVSAVRALFRAGGGEGFRTELARLLERPWATVVIDWRARVMQFAGESR